MMLDTITSMDSSFVQITRVGTYCVAACLLSLSPWLALLLLQRFQKRGQAQAEKHHDFTTFCSEPLILPSRISHTRFLPKLHRFAYSYLLVGVPVSKDGFDVPLFSLDPQPWWKRGWLQIEARDHLTRSLDNSSLYEKLGHFLRENGLNPDDFPYAYLVTPPRFLDHYNSPASFWFLYSHDKKLAAMIAEVDNTFDERRCYVLYDGELQTPDGPKQSPVSRVDLPGHAEYSWAKDFHVSPFNPRDGGYSLRVIDPLAQQGSAYGSADITATVRSAKGHATLVARLSSVVDPINPAKMSLLQQATFLASWWWVGWMTWPRVLFQAAKLTFVRRLGVFYHPEPLRATVPRKSTEAERIFERCFRQYLRTLVEESSTPLSLTYTGAEPTPECPQLTETWSSTTPAGSDHPPKTLTLNILTPAFFSRMAQYPNIEAALLAEAIHTDARNRTVISNDAPALLHLLTTAPPTQPALDSTPWPIHLGWTTIRALRTPPAPATFPTAVPAAYPSCPAMIRGAVPLSTTNPHVPAPAPAQALSDLDAFVATRCSTADARAYVRAGTRFFLEERIPLFGPLAEVVVTIVGGLVGLGVSDVVRYFSGEKVGMGVSAGVTVVGCVFFRKLIG